MAVVPAGLDQQPAGVLVPGEGDVPAVLLVSGGVLRRGDPQPRGELARVREPGEVADLRDQPERRQRRDSTELLEDLHLGAPPLAAGDLLQASVECVELTLDPVQVGQQLLERFVRERVIQTLARDPRAVQLGPRRLSLAEDPAVAQELLEHPVTGRDPRAAHIIPAAQSRLVRETVRKHPVPCADRL